MQLCCPAQALLTEHPQGVPALGLVAVRGQGSVPGPLCSLTPSGTGPVSSLTTALSIPLAFVRVNDGLCNQDGNEQQVKLICKDAEATLLFNFVTFSPL